MKRNVSLAIACALAVGGIAAGCGGGDDNGSGGTGTSASLTKAEFIQKADQICAEGDNATSQQIQQQVPGVNDGQISSDDLAKVAKLAGQGVKDQITRIRALGVPAGDEGTVNSFLDAADTGADEIISNPDSLQGSNGVPNPNIAKANQEAKAYGLKVCGQS